MAVSSSYIKKFLIFDDPSLWKYLPLFFFGVALGGSLLKELDVVPVTYFSHSRNLLNLYFVKISWGWTLALLLPFIFLSNFYDKNLIYVFKHLTSLVVATAIWYLCTETFFYIENITGACYDNMEIMKFSTKGECKKAGFTWDGFDISGHCFILSYSTLLIVEEIAPMKHLRQQYHNRPVFIDALYFALNFIVFLWMWMFGCTSVYFHNTIQKFLGTFFGILGWSLTYKFWYINPLSPGLPPRHIEHKQQD
ncbi:acyl-coenzyme A diphosphatase FITM2-like [Trichomycterus rosablanca]|uniref:acyl-coenzyme A diphosphatase FITM2-like n=1 Tax=Trichomycterus rosablanca TaxID=2290929 RepID=UPI002F353503